MPITATQEQIDALKAAIFTGVQRVKFGDREVWYQNTDDMLAALRALEASVATESGQTRTRVVQTRKGL